MFQRFRNRREAGILLAGDLMKYTARPDSVVLGLPRGGVPVAYEVAMALNLPLDVFVVRKLGCPGQEELAIGSIASGGICLINEALCKTLQVSEPVLNEIIERENRELERRERLYRGNRPPPDFHGKTVIIVDDGLATGATMSAAVAAVKRFEPKQIVAAAPVASEETCNALKNKADVCCVCSVTPEPFYGVGMWYRDFEQTSDEEVENLLARADARGVPASYRA